MGTHGNFSISLILVPVSSLGNYSTVLILCPFICVCFCKRLSARIFNVCTYYCYRSYSILYFVTSVTWSIHFVYVHLYICTSDCCFYQLQRHHGMDPKHFLSLLPRGGHLDYLQCLSTTNAAAGNIPVWDFLWHRNSAAELLSHIYMYSSYSEFHSAVQSGYISPTGVWRFLIALNLHQHLVLPGFLICASLTQTEWHLTVLICISLIANMFEQLFICLLLWGFLFL